MQQVARRRDHDTAAAVAAFVAAATAVEGSIKRRRPFKRACAAAAAVAAGGRAEKAAAAVELARGQARGGDGRQQREGRLGLRDQQDLGGLAIVLCFERRLFECAFSFESGSN